MTSIQTAELYAKPRLQHTIHAWFQDSDGSRNASAIITSFLMEHKQPARRFAFWWKPNKPKDNRKGVFEMGVGNFTLQTPGFKMRLYMIFSDSLPIMHGLPEPSLIQCNEVVQDAFHRLFYHAEDQAKAAIKSNHTLSTTVPYLLFVGPYFASVTWQLGKCTSKPSDNGDFCEELKARIRLPSSPTLRKLYLLGTRDSAEEIENILLSSDRLAQPLIQEALEYVRNIEVGATNVDVDAQAVVGDRISSVPRPTASGSGSSLGTETGSIQESTVQSDLAGTELKRTLDVMELENLLPEPSKSVPPHAVAATTTDAPAGDPPRAKWNKK